MFTSSAAAAIASPFTALYAATKSFISSFGASLAVEVRHHGIDVLVFHPSPVNTRCNPSYPELCSMRRHHLCSQGDSAVLEPLPGISLPGEYSLNTRGALSMCLWPTFERSVWVGLIAELQCCRFYDKAHKLDVLDFFKAQAVHPDAVPDAVFRCIGRTVWADIGKASGNVLNCIYSFHVLRIKYVLSHA